MFRNISNCLAARPSLLSSQLTAVPVVIRLEVSGDAPEGDAGAAGDHAEGDGMGRERDRVARFHGALSLRK